MASFILPDVPASSADLEDYVAALFQAARFFVEKNIVERTDPGSPMLELDAVAYSYGDSAQTVLVEAKGGDWGYAELFKVIGWMTYLNLKRGVLFASKEIPGKDASAMSAKLSETGVSCVHLGDFSDAVKRFEDAGFPKIESAGAVGVWRYSYRIERRLIDRLAKSAKTSGRQGPSAALEYHNLVNNGVFFVADPRDRLRKLYEAYQSHPKVSLSLAREIDGEPFDPQAQSAPSKAYKAALVGGDHVDLQACFYVEHRARLAILKAAVDALEAGYFAKQGAGSLKIVLKELMLPGSFLAGLEELRGHSHFRLYPLFWQVFLWAFGGLLLAERINDEYELLSKQTGVPVSEVPRALTAFDVLFPLPNGNKWIAGNQYVDYDFVKLTPAPFQGLGAAVRRSTYNVKNFSEFVKNGAYTGTNLGTRVGNLVALLK